MVASQRKKYLKKKSKKVYGVNYGRDPPFGKIIQHDGKPYFVWRSTRGRLTAHPVGDLTLNSFQIGKRVNPKLERGILKPFRRKKQK